MRNNKITSKSIVKEACVESISEALKAEKLGADRLEFCSKLVFGGLSPAKGDVEKAIKLLSIPIKVMVRPRKGNFIYNEEEIIKMTSEIQIFKNLGVEEVVLGCQNKNRNIDLIVLKKLVKKTKPMKITFHKAIDCTKNILEALEALAKIDEITSILTSGGKDTAYLGRKEIKEIIKTFGNRFNIIVAGSVTQKNIYTLHDYIGAEEYHGRRIVGDLT